jgi:hypothetical protein
MLWCVHTCCKNNLLSETDGDEAKSMKLNRCDTLQRVHEYHCDRNSDHAHIAFCRSLLRALIPFSDSTCVCSLALQALR